jgi:predicted RNA-binding Zn-ribbon protein involved in translation (DUF1610 family)
MGDTELVVVGTFLNQIEADMAKGALEAADIESMISADDAGGLRPHLWMGGVRLLVRAEDAERAVEILNQRSSGDDAVQRSRNPIEPCPQCGHHTVGQSGRGGWSGVRPFGYVPKEARSLAYFKCNKCGHEWEDKRAPVNRDVD